MVTGGWDVVTENVPGHARWRDASFVGSLTEGVFDAAAYRQLEAALAGDRAGARERGDAGLAVHLLFSRVALLLTSHFDPSDTYRVSRVGDADLRAFEARFRHVIACWYAGEDPELARWGDDGVPGT